MSIVMNKKRKEPINKVAIKLACRCTCLSYEYTCDCSCTDTRSTHSNYGSNEASECGKMYYQNSDRANNTSDV